MWILNLASIFFIFIHLINETSSKDSGCGVPAIKPIIHGNERIINGENALEGSWPWVVSLKKIQSFGSLSIFCGGSLIEKDLVVTAAHCMDNININNFVVVVGSYDQSLKTNLTDIFYPKQYVIPSAFSRSKIYLGYDIALIRLTKSVTLSEKIGLICIPSSNDSDTVLNKELVTTGW